MKPENEFQKIVKESKESSFVGELWALVCTTKKYWLIPIIVVLLAARPGSRPLRDRGRTVYLHALLICASARSHSG